MVEVSLDPCGQRKERGRCIRELSIAGIPRGEGIWCCRDRRQHGTPEHSRSYGRIHQEDRLAQISPKQDGHRRDQGGPADHLQGHPVSGGQVQKEACLDVVVHNTTMPHEE